MQDLNKITIRYETKRRYKREDIIKKLCPNGKSSNSFRFDYYKVFKLEIQKCSPFRYENQASW